MPGVSHGNLSRLGQPGWGPCGIAFAGQSLTKTQGGGLEVTASTYPRATGLMMATLRWGEVEGTQVPEALSSVLHGAGLDSSSPWTSLLPHGHNGNRASGLPRCPWRNQFAAPPEQWPPQTCFCGASKHPPLLPWWGSGMTEGQNGCRILEEKLAVLWKFQEEQGTNHWEPTISSTARLRPQQLHVAYTRGGT